MSGTLSSGLQQGAGFGHQEEGTGDESDGVAGRDSQRVFEMRGNPHVRVIHEAAEYFRSDSAMLARRGDHDFARVREENAAYFGDGFVAHGPIDQANAPGGVEPLDISGQGTGRGGIMRAIEDDFGADGNQLQAAGPARGGDAGANGRSRHAKGMQSQGGGDGVFDLVFAANGQSICSGEEKAGEGALAARPLRMGASGVQFEPADLPAGGAGDGATNLSARASSTGPTSARWRAKTAGTPGFRMPAFSPAMDSRPRPRKAS